MGRRAIEHARVRGPYRHRDGWRVETIDPEAARGESGTSTDYFGTKEEADEFIEIQNAKLARLYGVTFDDGLKQYRTWMVEKKGNQAGSADETVRRLRLFFEDVIGWRMAKLSAERGAELYEAFTKRTYEVGPKKARRQKPYSVDHHRHTLAQAKTFLRWCVKPQGWLKSNPLDGVDGIGQGSVGKEQFTGDESRAFYQWCVRKATRGDRAALGLIMCLLMALRSGDVFKRVVRDVDLDGTVLRIGVGSSRRSKSKKGDVPREIPAPLQPLIRAVIAGRSPLEPLFPAADGGFHCNSWLRSAAKRFCKEAGVPYVTPHGLKGTAGTLASTRAGALANQVAEYLSHEQQTTSERNYLAAGAAEAATARRAFQIIEGGKQS